MGITAEAQFHVLAVDDSLIDRKLIERLLKTSSYQVTTVESGRKALEFLGLQDEQRLRSSPSVSPCQQEIEVNLVITDYCMPGMTGYDLLKKIKESSSKKNIPVVIMSSEHVPSRINRCLEEGAEEFLLKPVQLSDMKRLRPHILKGKSKDLQQLKQQQQVVPPPPTPLSPQPQQNNNHHNNNATGTTTTNSSSNTNNDNNNKRKALDEGLSPAERTRPRYTVAA